MKAYEDLCSQLPNVPGSEDPDEVIVQRLQNLKAWEETDNEMKPFPAPSANNFEKIEVKVSQESRIKNLKLKENKTEGIKGGSFR